MLFLSPKKSALHTEHLFAWNKLIRFLTSEEILKPSEVLSSSEKAFSLEFHVRKGPLNDLTG